MQQIATDVNYFDLLGLKEAIEIEFQTLQSAYFKLQSAMHPDRFTNKSQDELQVAVSNSAIVNNAYMILSNKFERAQYLIGLHTSLEAKVPADFMALSFSLHERKIDGEDIESELKALEASFWLDLSSAQGVGDWAEAALLISKLKIISRLRE